MGRLYLETNAVRMLTDYQCSEEVYTSVFVLFELISGINSQREFYIRKAVITRIFEQKIEIKEKMVDQLLFEFTGEQKCDAKFYEMIYKIAEKLIKTNSYSEFKKYYIPFMHNQSINNTVSVNVLDWLRDWDKQISSIRGMGAQMFDEHEGFIKRKYKEEGIRGIAQHLWRKCYEGRYNEERFSHSMAFQTQALQNVIRSRIDELFSRYNFKLFIKAHAIFIKAFYIDGGKQDRNNPSDILHLLYLDEGDKLVSSDKIFETVKEAAEEFQYLKLEQNKKLDELINNNE